MHGIGVLVVDLIPQFLEFLLFEVRLVKPVILDFGLVAVFDHSVNGDRFVEDGLHKFMDISFHGGDGCLLDWLQRSVLGGILIYVGDVALFVDVIVNEQVGVNGIRFGLCNRALDSIDSDILANKEFFVGLCRAGTQDFLGFGLKARDEILVAFVCNDGQLVDFVNVFAEGVEVHAIAVDIYTQAETAANFLAFCCCRTCVAQGADLEHVRVVPTFA